MAAQIAPFAQGQPHASAALPKLSPVAGLTCYKAEMLILRKRFEPMLNAALASSEF